MYIYILYQQMAVPENGGYQTRNNIDMFNNHCIFNVEMVINEWIWRAETRESWHPNVNRPCHE